MGAGRLIICRNCAGRWRHHFGGLCPACGQYWHRTGRPRPAYLYAPLTWRCGGCGEAHRPHKARGLCGRCYDALPALRAYRRAYKRAYRARQREAAA